MTSQPREADYRWFVVSERGRLRGDGYDVRVHKHYAFLFDRGHGSSDGTKPGWLGATRFETYDEAVAFGQEMTPIIERAYIASNEWNQAVHELTSLIGKLPLEPARA